jgi:hypothetical protein
MSVHEIKSGKCNKKAIAFPYRPPLILKMQNVSVLLKKIKQQMQEIYRRLSEKNKGLDTDYNP